MNLLFVGNEHNHRSKTAEEIFKNRFKTKSAGLFNDKPVSHKHLNWADLIFVMEEQHSTELAKRFPKEYAQNKIVSLDIPDHFYLHQPELIKRLESGISEHL